MQLGSPHPSSQFNYNFARKETPKFNMAQSVVALMMMQQVARDRHETAPRGPIYDIRNNYVSFQPRNTRIIDELIVAFDEKGRARMGGKVGRGQRDYAPDLGSHKVYATNSRLSVTWVTFIKISQGKEEYYYCTYSSGSWSTNLFAELTALIFEADAKTVRHIVLEVSARHHNELYASLNQVERRLPWPNQQQAANEIMLDWKHRRRPSCVLLCGPSNIGKTELGNELYYRMKTDMGYDDGYVFPNVDLLKLDSEFNFRIGQYITKRSFAIVMVNECDEYLDKADERRVQVFLDAVSNNQNLIFVMTTERQQFPTAWTSRLRPGRVSMIMRMTADKTCLVMRQYQEGEDRKNLPENTLTREDVFILPAESI